MKNIKNKLKYFKDRRGYLYPIEFEKLSFKPKRAFIVSNVPNATIRGEHAHYKTKQLLICLSGTIEVGIHDGKKWNKFFIHSGESYLIENKMWDYQKFYNKSILLVLCSTKYDKNDYIDNFENFIKLKNK